MDGSQRMTSTPEDIAVEDCLASKSNFALYFGLPHKWPSGSRRGFFVFIETFKMKKVLEGIESSERIPHGSDSQELTGYHC